MDVFDQFVLAGQSVTVGEAVIRRYRPVSSDNDHIVLHIFSSERDDCKVSISCHKSDIFFIKMRSLKIPHILDDFYVLFSLYKLIKVRMWWLKKVLTLLHYSKVIIVKFRDHKTLCPL